MIVVLAIGWLALAIGLIGTLYMAVSTLVFARFFHRLAARAGSDTAVTILKPLHGAEPLLAQNVGSFLAQDHAGPVQLLCGVQRADDPAIAAVRTLGDAATLVVDPRRHGASAKIGNLVNLDAHATHDVIVLSDSDMAVPSDYLAAVLGALDAPGVGAVSLLYAGRGDAGFWSRMGASGISYQFLPGAAFGVATGLATPCMGSTIALRRETLARIGGFAAFADVLADDYAIGAAVRALGLRIAIPPLLVTHGCAETSFAELWRHELRWSATVRGVVPGAFAASVIGMPLPLALIGTLLSGAWAAGGALVILALLSRLALVHSVDRQTRSQAISRWSIPFRDALTFAVFVASWFVRSVDWRGERLRLSTNGGIAAEPEPTS